MNHLLCRYGWILEDKNLTRVAKTYFNGDRTIKFVYDFRKNKNVLLNYKLDYKFSNNGATNKTQNLDMYPFHIRICTLKTAKTESQGNRGKKSLFYAVSGLCVLWERPS